MKNKEPVGDSDEVPEDIKGKLNTLTAEDLTVRHYSTVSSYE